MNEKTLLVTEVAKILNRSTTIVKKLCQRKILKTEERRYKNQPYLIIVDDVFNKIKELSKNKSILIRNIKWHDN